MLKFGVIGCGAISGVHASAIEHIQEAELAACCDLDEEKGRMFAEKNQCAYFKDYRDLLKTDLDIVTIAAPHFLHKEMTIAALKAGKHVICEKPMAITSSEAEEVNLIVKESSLHYAVCFQNRFNDSFITLKSLIDQRKFGKLNGVKCELTWKRDADYYRSASWKGSYKTEGGGVLINQAIHTLDAISWLLQQPKQVKGRILTSLLEGVVEVEDAAVATAQWADGTPLVIFASNDYSTDTDPVITFDFEEATVELTMNQLLVNGEIINKRSALNEEAQKAVWGTGHCRLFRAFVNQINGKEDSLIANLATTDGKKAIDLLTSIYRSDETNAWEQIPIN